MNTVLGYQCRVNCPCTTYSTMGEFRESDQSLKQKLGQEIAGLTYPEISDVMVHFEPLNSN